MVRPACEVIFADQQSVLSDADSPNLIEGHLIIAEVRAAPGNLASPGADGEDAVRLLVASVAGGRQISANALRRSTRHFSSTAAPKE